MNRHPIIQGLARCCVVIGLLLVLLPVPDMPSDFTGIRVAPFGQVGP